MSSVRVHRCQIASDGGRTEKLSIYFVWHRIPTNHRELDCRKTEIGYTRGVDSETLLIVHRKYQVEASSLIYIELESLIVRR
jgi:hypothetical protein